MGNRERDEGGSIEELFSDESAVDEFFSPDIRRGPGRPPKPLSKPGPKPSHYKVVSISLYTDDIERLAELVTLLKEQGHSRANRSMVIREALRQIDLEKVPPQR